ncbi:hypothetical protein AN901_203314 [Pseudomonas syringae pv. theae]|nr:hypothetical protein AN901_203314 [Pseudomonas syringae pv. theae]
MSTLPLWLSILPDWRLSIAAAAMRVLAWPFSVAPWLFRVWLTVACKARLAVMLPLLLSPLADSVTSPELLRLLSALTPASITAELLS